MGGCRPEDVVYGGYDGGGFSARSDGDRRSGDRDDHRPAEKWRDGGNWERSEQWRGSAGESGIHDTERERQG